MKKSKPQWLQCARRTASWERAFYKFFLWFTTSPVAVKGRDAIQWFNNKNFDFDQCCSISDYPVSIKYVDPLKERLPITVVVAEGV